MFLPDFHTNNSSIKLCGDCEYGPIRTDHIEVKGYPCEPPWTLKEPDLPGMQVRGVKVLGS